MMNWDYVAGFFDGEGCVAIHIEKVGERARTGFGYRLVPTLKITQKRADVLHEIQAFIKCGYLGLEKGVDGSSDIVVRSQSNLYRICRELIPRTIVKKRQLQLLCRFLEVKGSFTAGELGKEPFLELLDIAQQISSESTKRHRNYQQKIEKVKAEINESHWSPEMRRIKISEHAHSRLLNYQIACEIREKYAQGNITQRELAKLYGVSQSNIYNITLNRIWRNRIELIVDGIHKRQTKISTIKNEDYDTYQDDSRKRQLIF